MLPTMCEEEWVRKGKLLMNNPHLRNRLASLGNLLYVSESARRLGYHIVPDEAIDYIKTIEHALDNARLRLRLLEKHLEQHGFPREGPMRSIANGDPLPWEAGYDVGMASTKAKDLPERTGKRLGDKETKDGAGFQ